MNTENLYRARIKRAIPLLPCLACYSAVLHGPCDECGCVLWATVSGGYRCLKCMPPLEMSREHRTMLETATDGDPIFLCSRRRCSVQRAIWKGGEVDADG